MSFEVESKIALSSRHNTKAIDRPVRIMIVDDHPIVREGLAAVLTGHSDLMICTQAEDIEGAMHAITAQGIDLAIIDLSLKNESGLQLIRQITELDATVRILVVSVHDERFYGARAMAAGARGFLNKQTASKNIVEAIRQILDGKNYFRQELWMTGPSTGEEECDGKDAGSGTELPLTERELTVFRLIGDGRTTAEIARHLHLSVKTIESHRQNIKKKLKLSNGAILSREAAQWVFLNRQ